MTTTITKRKKSQRQSIDFNSTIDGMSEAELIERIRPKTPPVPFEMLPKELQEGIKEGLRDIDAGRVTPHEEVFRKLRAWLKNDHDLM
jgi:hypothetical protein